MSEKTTATTAPPTTPEETPQEPAEQEPSYFTVPPKPQCPEGGCP